MTSDADEAADRYDHLASYRGPVTLPGPLLRFLPVRIDALDAAAPAGEKAPPAVLPRPPRLVPLRAPPRGRLAAPTRGAIAPSPPGREQRIAAIDEGLGAATGLYIAHDIASGGEKVLGFLWG